MKNFETNVFDVLNQQPNVKNHTLFLEKLLTKLRKQRSQFTALLPVSAVAIVSPTEATSENDSAVSSIPQPIKGIPNAATLNLLSLGFNQSNENADQWVIFSSDIDQFYIDRHNQIQDNLNSVFGKYMNYNHLVHNWDGPDTVNAEIAQRLIELKYREDLWEDGEYTTEEITQSASCLSGSNPNGMERDSDFIQHSICLSNKVMAIEGYEVAVGTGHVFPQWRTDLSYAAAAQHEYFHHYQKAHTLDRGLDSQSYINGEKTSIAAPWFWIEPAAMAAEMWYLRDNWTKFDYLKKYDASIINDYIDEEIQTRNESFYNTAKLVQTPYDSDKTKLDVYDWKLGPVHQNYPHDGARVGYTPETEAQANAMATIAPIHFLAYKSSWQAALRDIPADYYELGFWGAVEKHTGLNEQAFYDEFNALMRSVDLDTISKDYAPEGWKIPDGNISGVVDFLNISPFASGSFTINGEFVTRLGSKISDADVVMSDGTKTTTYKTTDDGSVSGALRESLTSSIKGDLSYLSSTKAISSQDALDALKLSVGLSTSAGTKNAFDFMSADFNQDGKVSSQDALSILKYSVGLTTPEQAKWVFVDTNGDYSGISKSNTSYTEGVSIADLSADTSISLTGILIGDVNDSYSGLIA